MGKVGAHYKNICTSISKSSEKIYFADMGCVLPIKSAALCCLREWGQAPQSHADDDGKRSLVNFQFDYY